MVLYIFNTNNYSNNLTVLILVITRYTVQEIMHSSCRELLKSEVTAVEREECGTRAGRIDCDYIDSGSNTYT